MVLWKFSEERKRNVEKNPLVKYLGKNLNYAKSIDLIINLSRFFLATQRFLSYEGKFHKSNNLLNSIFIRAPLKGYYVIKNCCFIVGEFKNLTTKIPLYFDVSLSVQEDAGDVTALKLLKDEKGMTKRK